MKTLRTSFARPSEGNRHRKPWADGSRRKFVEVWHSSEEGDLKQGLIRMSRKMSGAKPDTNDHHAKMKHIEQNLARWDELMRLNGWAMASRPKVKGPFNPPTASVEHEADPDEVWYWATAFFKRTSPIYVPFEDFLESQRMAEILDIDTNKPVLPWTEQGNESTDWEVGWKSAERLFAKTGLKIEDYRYDDEKVGSTGVVADLLAGKTAGIG